MTPRVGIIGYPLGHSLSPAFQQAAFDHYGMDVRFYMWETLPRGLARMVDGLRAPDVLGANVTVPHKESVIPLLDRLRDSARSVGAVNTVVNRSGDLEGHNTDTTGFLRALIEEGAFNPAGKRVLLLGAGGSARAAAQALVGQRVASLTVANRTLERAQDMVMELPATCRLEAVPLTTEALGDGDRWDLIVNCTTLGMRHGPGEGQSPLPAGAISADTLVYDLVYNPRETPLLGEARKAGARTLGGLPMLVYQGAEAFTLWTGREAPLSVMFHAAEEALEETEGRLS